MAKIDSFGNAFAPESFSPEKAIESMAEALMADSHAAFVRIQPTGTTRRLILSETEDGPPFFIFTLEL